MQRAAIVGISGYVGGEIARILLAHPAFELGAMTAASSAGQSMAQVHPHLTELHDRDISTTEVHVLAEHDVVFLALPHGASANLVRELDEIGATCTIIDSGADFRLRDESAWTEFYDTPYAGSWPYGLPELPVDRGAKKQRQVLKNAKRIAVPGCYPTATSLALTPGFAAGILIPADVVVVAASGVSGAGRQVKPHLMGAELIGSMSAYGVGGVHRHIPEVQQNIAAACGIEERTDVSVSFTPTLAPMTRGILATASAHLTSEVSAHELREIWLDTYADEPFITVLPEEKWPSTADVFASNRVHLQVTVDKRVNRVIAIAAIDNLYKGAAGAAVQCANLALGLEETMGLARRGVRP